MLWHSELRGRSSVVNDAERLECEREVRPLKDASSGRSGPCGSVSVDSLSGALLWRTHSKLFSGFGLGGIDKNKRPLI